ncbi:transcriptional regulator [Paenibacillus sp. J31TS4]|uniref:ArsR/SmtB family transcription factor n=1 Tax=Paenibacillus sp. J31TS4 TaxID=2807195 RepID=UPI001BD0EABE|nr:MarR family transcriptional regulator [Paenibacillus sp. J31TS4]
MLSLIEVTRRHTAFFEALGSETRLHLLELLYERPHNIKELAEALGMSSAIITRHVQKLEGTGLVRCESVPGVRGSQKRCSVVPERVTLFFGHIPEQPGRSPDSGRRHELSVPIGQYSEYAVKPTCGLVARDRIIGLLDDPRYFSDPARTEAAHLWFSEGYVEYRLPNYLLGQQRITRLTISLEICSEAPGSNDRWPSDISFFLQGRLVGVWTCPGDFGSQRGALTPAWWQPPNTQFGLLKSLQITETGTLLDGVRLSGVTLAELGLQNGEDIRLRLASLPDATHPGGISLFGGGFGHYDQDIRVTMDYD